MEKLPNLFLKLSLEEMACRRVVVNLFHEADVVPTIQNFQIRVRHFEIENEDEWGVAVDEKVKAKVSSLHIPTSLKQQMMRLVTPIGNEILKWKIFFADFDAVVPELLCWTPAGAVDDRKTAEKVVRRETFDVAKRYHLACLYCLDDCLPPLWEDLPKEKRQELFHFLDQPFERYWVFGRSVDMDVHWAYILRSENSYLDSVVSERFRLYETFSSSHQCAFESSVRARNKSATEYFFQQLTSEERVSSLVRVTNDVLDHSIYQCYVPYFFLRENIPGVLCYLLSAMSREQKIQVITEHSYEILECFLVWPWRDLFLDIAQLVMTFLPENDYDLMLINITSHIVDARCYIPNLIQKFFLLIPTEFRKHFALSLCYHFPEFLCNEDVETIKVFLKNVDPKHKEGLVFESRFLSSLGDLVLKDEWKLVEVVVRETSLSKEMKKRLKEEFLKEFRPDNDEDKKIRLKRFFEILEEKEVTV